MWAFRLFRVGGSPLGAAERDGRGSRRPKEQPKVNGTDKVQATTAIGLVQGNHRGAKSRLKRCARTLRHWLQGFEVKETEEHPHNLRSLGISLSGLLKNPFFWFSRRVSPLLGLYNVPAHSNPVLFSEIPAPVTFGGSAEILEIGAIDLDHWEVPVPYGSRGTTAVDPRGAGGWSQVEALDRCKDLCDSKTTENGA